MIAPKAPVVTLDALYHYGSLNPRDAKKYATHGPGLAAAEDPLSWALRLVRNDSTHHLWLGTPRTLDERRFIDFNRSRHPEFVSAVYRWACENGYLSHRPLLYTEPVTENAVAVGSVHDLEASTAIAMGEQGVVKKTALVPGPALPAQFHQPFAPMLFDLDAAAAYCFAADHGFDGAVLDARYFDEHHKPVVDQRFVLLVDGWQPNWRFQIFA